VKRAWDLLLALTAAELRESRDFTLAGFAKWVLEPISYMLVYFIVVASILDRYRVAYPLFLFCALIPWRYFSGVIQESMFLMNRYAETIKNRAFPTAVLPLVLMAAEATTFLVSLVLFAPLMAYYDIGPTWSLLALPLVVLVLFLVTSGPTFLAAIFGLYFPDFRGAAQNLIRVGFFVSSGLVPIAEVPGDELPLLLQANPMTGIFDAFRAIIIDGRAPDWVDLAYPAAVGTIVLALGLGIFRWRMFELPKEV
jgi:ABC-type polysaccharide/polyol phosphate export permease